jgi:hypothetical protein
MNFSWEREHRAFLDEDQRHLQLVDGDVVLEVAYSRSVFSHRRIRTWGALEGSAPSVELDAAGLLGRLHVHELAHHLVILPLGVGAQQLALGGDGVALPFLLLGGDPGVQHGLAG